MWLLAPLATLSLVTSQTWESGTELSKASLSNVMLSGVVTTVRPAAVCPPHQATCANGECIDRTAICDGDIDCSDGSDESSCRKWTCTGKFILQFPIAGDNSLCEPNEYQCANKKCVLKTWRCDGDDDCGDGSDETECTPNPPGSPCRYYEWECASRDQCIPRAFQCDGENDCQDNSDEFGCSKLESQLIISLCSRCRISHHCGVSPSPDHSRPELHLHNQLHGHGSSHPAGGLETQLGPRAREVQPDQQSAGGEQIIRGAELSRGQPAGPRRVLLRGHQQYGLLLCWLGRLRSARPGRHSGGEAGGRDVHWRTLQQCSLQPRAVLTVLLLRPC